MEPAPTATEQLNASITSPSNWRYVSEGGATIVFSYRGPENPHFSDTVLRLRKIAIGHSGSQDGGDHTEVDEVDPSVAFQERVISRLLDPKFLPRLQTVLVEPTWLEALRTASEHFRPSERKLKDTIDVRRCKAVLATDLIGTMTRACEIKVRIG